MSRSQRQLLSSLFLPVALGLVTSGSLRTASLEACQTVTAVTRPAQEDVHEIRMTTGALTEQEPKMARGRVFIDRNRDGIYSPGDSLFQGIRVSNGHEIVKTDERGEYQLPVTDDTIIFVIKPRGFRTPLNDDNLPQFFYIHKPLGSPKLKYPGVAPTGPLPQSIDFPLYPQQEPERFEVILFGDPQPRNNKEVDYIAHDVVEDLIGIRAGFGVTLGDIAFDDLTVYGPLNQTVALIGVPWYNVIGNHDVNYDVAERRFNNETYERVYGPSYYSFDYGHVHFVVMDNIDWEVKENGSYGFSPNFGAEQLAFLEKDLALCPESQMVVLMMHVPVISVKDQQDLYRLIESRPLCISISGHTHTHEHQWIDASRGWKGTKPHHHIVNVTVSGSWWSGQKDERGIPHTTMADGGPNGHSRISFDGGRYELNYFAAGVESGQQMRIELPSTLKISESKAASMYVNVFNGDSKSHVAMRIDGQGDWVALSKVDEVDPYFQRLYDEDQKSGDPDEPRLTRPKVSTHIWKTTLGRELEPGVHLIEVQATDCNGKNFISQRSVRVVED